MQKQTKKTFIAGKAAIKVLLFKCGAGIKIRNGDITQQQSAESYSPLFLNNLSSQVRFVNRKRVASSNICKAAAAVVLPVKVIFLRKLNASLIAFTLFKVRRQILYAVLFLQLRSDRVNKLCVFVRAHS